MRGEEGGSLANEAESLIKETPAQFWPSALERADVWIVEEPSPDTQYDDSLPLDFLASITTRNNPMLTSLDL